MKRVFSCCILLILLSTAVAAEDRTDYVSLFGYDLLSLESRQHHSFGAGGAILGEEFTFLGLYRRQSLAKIPVPDFPGGYHSVDLLYDTDRGRHQIVGLFKSESDQPVAGGWTTFQAAAVYGYEVVATDALTLALGGGLAVSDFGIELEGGGSWPVLPVPFIRASYESRFVKGGFDFITGPNLSLTFFPASQLRLAGEARMDQFRDERDLIFTTALEYRFFAQDHPAGDIAGIALGFKNDILGFTPGGSDEPYELTHYALFAELDVTLLSIGAGFAFQGRERYGEEIVRKAGDGYFFSVQGMYQF